MEPRPSVFDYQDHSQYLRDVGNRRPPRGRARTYSQWARQLRYRSPRGIAMVLQGKRLPSADMLHRLSGHLGHSAAEHRYLEVLVEREKLRRQGRPAEALERELRRINPKCEATQPLSLEAFASMEKWFFYVVKQLAAAPRFREDYDWIRRRLRGKVSVAEIRSALRILTQLGLLERDGTGRLRAARASVSVPHDIASAALREHHRGLAQRAIEALEEQAPADREFDALTLRVSPRALPRIKEAIRHFVNQFDKAFEDLESDRVYQLNVQFFEHTVPMKEGKTR